MRVPVSWLRLALVLFLAATPLAPGRATEHDTFSYDEILNKAQGFFGTAAEGLAKAIEKVFEDQGRPNAYIEGEEVSGAFVVGLRYGRGTLVRKG